MRVNFTCRAGSPPLSSADSVARERVATTVSRAAFDPRPRAQTALVALGALIAGALLLAVHEHGALKATLLGIGLALGVSLYHAAFGFTGAYRRAIVERDISGIGAQFVMLAVAIALFAPVLAAGEIFGHGVTGAVAPVSVSMVLGAFLFGVGMQMGGGCASGTLFTVGGGNLRMLVVLAFFCLGCFWASLHMHRWTALPGIGAVSVAESYGVWPAVAMQLAALGIVYGALYAAGGRNKRALWWRGEFSGRRLLRGPWPLLLGALALALLNWLTLLLAGHPWSITWGFTLWAAKLAVLLGWDPAGNPFWSGGFQQAALARPILADTTSVMNLGIVVGAFMAASVAGRIAPRARMALPSLLAAVLGGLLLGYGARLAYGCNIGAFFSGAASASLHGWVWLPVAILGNVVGVKLRPLFGLDARAAASDAATA